MRDDGNNGTKPTKNNSEQSPDLARENAAGTLSAYVAIAGGDSRDREQCVINLLTDLLHLCAHERVNFWRCLNEAKENYSRERGTAHGNITTVLAALRFLAQRCDGAHREDGVGFNVADTDFGRELAARNWLSEKQYQAALKMLRKYRRQLSTGGITLPEE